ncbi:MAG: SEC-C domain-containing protein [Chloroflexi bacterium]|nr:SEC-C domain-containing protein [Chloroflexota bacterium]
MSRYGLNKKAPKPNDPCPCGSGKPYKDCCGKGK